VASAVDRSVSLDRGMRRTHAALCGLEREQLPRSCDWLRYRWLDHAFSERYWRLLGCLTCQPAPGGTELSETLLAWKHLFSDVDSLYRFSKCPKPFDRYPVGEIRARLSLHGPYIYRTVALVGLRLYSEWCRPGGLIRIPLLHRMAGRSATEVWSGPAHCLDLLDGLRVVFLRVVESPFYSDDDVDAV
jgi:hypothetical protein